MLLVKYLTLLQLVHIVMDVIAKAVDAIFETNSMILISFSQFVTLREGFRVVLRRRVFV